MLIVLHVGSKLDASINEKMLLKVGVVHRYPVPQWSGICGTLERASLTLAEKYCTADLMWSSDEGELHEFAADFSVRTTIYIQCIGCCFKAKWENRNKANIRGVNKSSTAVTRPSCTVQNESTLLENTGT
jgi:hypothetical protein